MTRWAAAYRATVAFEEMMRNRAPGRAPQRPTLVLAMDASTVMGTEMGVVQRIADRGGPLDPEDLASMRAADLDELNEAAPERIGGPVWVYFLDDKGGFRADWVLVNPGRWTKVCVFRPPLPNISRPKCTLTG